MAKIQRALLSVYDKTGLIPFAEVLVKAGVELISTGGTAKALRERSVTPPGVNHPGLYRVRSCQAILPRDRSWQEMLEDPGRLVLDL